MESIFSRGGALDLHPEGTNRLQIPKGWRPQKLFEPICFDDGNSVANLGSTPEDSRFGSLKGKDSRRSRCGGGKGRGGFRKRQFDDAFSTEHVGLAPDPTVEEDKEDVDDGVQYRDNITPEEDTDDLLLYLDGIPVVDDGLWTRWVRNSLPQYSSKLTPSGIASGRGDSSSEKAFSLGWGRIPRELASQAACMATLISTPPSPSAYAVALCQLYYTNDSNTAQSLLAFVNAAARKYITSLDFGSMMSSEILGDYTKNDGDRLFQPDDKRPYQRVIRALNGHGGGHYRGLYLQHILFVANEVTEVFKDEVIGSLSGASATTREGESVRRQNARGFLCETFGFNREIEFIKGNNSSASACRDVVCQLLRAILLSSPTVKDFCRTYRIWLLVFLNEKTPTFSLSEQIETQSCHPSFPLVSTEISDSAVSLFRVLLVIIGKPACYFSGTRECDDIAEEVAKVMTFSTEIILSSIGFDAAHSSSDTNYSNGESIAKLAQVAVSGHTEKKISKADASGLGQLSWPFGSLSDKVRSLFSSSLSNFSVNKYCSRLLADLFLSADDARRHFENVLSGIETRAIDDGSEKASCVLNRAIECQLHMYLGRSALSIDDKSKSVDQMPQDVSPETLLRLIRESPSCESFPPFFKHDEIKSNPIQALLDDFAEWMEKSCQEFNSRWRNSHLQSSESLQSWTNLQLSPNLGQLRRCVGGGTVQVEDEINDKGLRFKLHEDLIFEPSDTICDTNPLSRDDSLPSPSSPPRLSSIARLPGRAILQSSSNHSNLQCLAEEMRISLQSTHRPLSQMMSHFILLLSCLTRRMSAKLNAYSNAFYGVSIKKDSIQAFNNRVLTQTITFLRPSLQLTSRMSLIRNLALTSQSFNGSENFTMHLNSSREAAVNDLQTICNLSLTAPSSVHLLHSLVNVQSTEYDSFDKVFEVISKHEPLPFIRAQIMYSLKARVLPILSIESINVINEKLDKNSRGFLFAFVHGVLSAPNRQRIQRRYVQLPAIDSKRYASASKKNEYNDLDSIFDEYEAFRGKTKESMKGDGRAKIDVKDQLIEKSVKAIRIQTSPSKGDSLLRACRDKEKKDEVTQKTRYEALTAQRKKTLNDEALQKTRYEESQRIRGSTADQDPNAPSSKQRNPPTSFSGKGPHISPHYSNTSALPIPPKNQSYSAECKSCTFELEYTLIDTTSWICGIPITCRVCDNLIAFCCDDEKCNKVNYVTINLVLGPTQILVCFACKKPYGSTQTVVNRGRTASTSKPSCSASFGATPSASASSAPSIASLSVLTRATPTEVAPVRIILTLPSLTRMEKAATLGPSTMSSPTQLTTQSIVSSQLIPSAITYPLLVSETYAGRLVSFRARTSQLLEKKISETV
jgi:hypothetical protein